MSCSQCGNPAVNSPRNCPNCNPAGGAPYTAENAEKDRQAGAELGHGLVAGIAWLFGNRYLALFWFWLVWVIATYSIGQHLGYVSDDWMQRPFALDLFGFFLPIVLAVVFRKQIPRLMKWVWLGLAALLLGRCVLGS